MPASQYVRVKSVLEHAERPLALFEIALRIRFKFNKLDSDAAISARIRDIRHHMEIGNIGTVVGKKAGPRKAYYIYQLVKG